MHKPEAREYALTPYDEFPVHQAPYSVSYVPSTDCAWDEGYFFGVYSAEAQVFMITGMRVNPNADIVGAHVGVNLRDGHATFVSCNVADNAQVDALVETT